MILPKKHIECGYTDYNEVYIYTWWTWFNHVFFEKRYCLLVKHKIGSTWSCLICRKDADAKLIKECVMKLSMTVRYLNKSYAEIYRIITNDFTD